MSYILDALRKSESDRYQEKLPELGGSAPIWLRKKKKNSVWPWVIVVALLLNAGVLAYLFWPRPTMPTPASEPAPASEPTPASEPVPTATSTPASVSAAPAPVSEPVALAPPAPHQPQEDIAPPDEPAFQAAQPAFVRQPIAPLPEDELSDDAPVDEVVIGPGYQIRPSAEEQPVPQEAELSQEDELPQETPDDIPRIEDLSPADQQMIPALKFSSHIYSSNPESRRIVINQRYLREGQSVQGVRVVEVTEEGVVLGVSGMVFRIPVLRDWSPDGG
ncbi:MAG: general secretion pathway protein GspB [Hahellaceae bacterium]|nr:general secretion pathway protein GspB [Hahellaceae bacterium]